MKVVITAGGTGGHIYPALAIINKLKKEEKNLEVLYIGTHNRMEKDIIPAYNIPFKSLKVTGFKRKISISNFKTVTNFLKAIKEAKKILKDFKPDVVVGAGGYVTGPVIYAANKLKIKTMIHEQNTEIGLANKFLLKYSDVVMTSFNSTKDIIDHKNVVYTGNPCIDTAINVNSADKTIYGLSKSKKLVLVVMGSLGSKSINNELIKIIPMFNEKKYEVLIVTGKNNYDEFVKNSKKLDNVKIFPYIDNLTSLMKKTDIMVSRAGASTISEIIGCNLPTIFIPSPYVTNNHQFKNASELVNKNAGIMIEEKDLSGDILVRTIDKLLINNSKLREIKKNLENFDSINSSEVIYKEIKKVVE